jgi:hypothetical protein
MMRASLVRGQPKSSVARAASFLLLTDSRTSFEIEGERPSRGRLERWAHAVAQAETTLNRPASSR